MGNDNVVLCVTIFNPPCEINDETTKKLNEIHKLAANAVGEALAINPDDVIVRSIHPRTKGTKYRYGLYSTLLVKCDWSDGLEDRSRDRQVQAVVFPIIGDHFGKEYDPQSEKALMHKGNEALWLMRRFAWLVFGRIVA